MSILNRRSLLTAGAAILAASGARAGRGRQESSAAASAASRTRFAVNAEIWWSSLPFVERIRKTAESGLTAIEFWPWRGKDLAEVEKACKDLNIEIAQFTAWGFSPGMNDPANHAQVVEEIKESCKVANRLSCKAMTVVAGNDQSSMTREQMHEHVITVLKLCAPIARDHGVTLILEPMNGRVDHPGHCLYGSEAAVRICKAVNSPHVKINWDLYHMQMSEGDLIGHLKEGFEWLGYAQLADAPGRHEPGTGEIHYPRVLKALHELGYRGCVGLECWPRDGEEAALERVREADRW